MEPRISTSTSAPVRGAVEDSDHGTSPLVSTESVDGEETEEGHLGRPHAKSSASLRIHLADPDADGKNHCHRGLTSAQPNNCGDHWTALSFERRGLRIADAMRYRALFVQHGVELSDAALIDHARLRDMGITQVGHRIKILKALHDLSCTVTPPKRTEESGISMDGMREVNEEADKRAKDDDAVILKDAWLSTTSSDDASCTHKKDKGHSKHGEKKKEKEKKKRRREAENGETSDTGTKRKNRRKQSNAHDAGAQTGRVTEGMEAKRDIEQHDLSVLVALAGRHIPPNIIADPRLLPDGQLVTAKARYPGKETNEQSRKRKTAASAATATSDIHLEKVDNIEENTLPLHSKRQKPCAESIGKSDEESGARDEGGINDEIRAAVAAAAEQIKLSNDSDNEEDLSGSESEEEEEEKVESHRTSCITIPLQQAPRPEESLPCIDFALIKDGQTDNLKQFILSAFRAAQHQPRPHQWETVFKVMLNMLQPVECLDGSMKNFLLQHATGSGKSLTIACLTCCLYLLRDIWEASKFRYNKIVVMNDRKILDEQLGDTVLQFLHANGISDVQRSKSSAHLAELMQADQPRVIITTMQKFIKLEKVGHQTEDEESEMSTTKKTIAIIADEAHRSHGRKNTRTMHVLYPLQQSSVLLGGTTFDQSNNISYFSFTCTPNYKALEMFGVRGTNGVFEPFHTYSIENCIRDGYVLNPLVNYRSVGIYAKLTRKRNDERIFEEGYDATYHLVKSAADDRVLLREKARYIVNHFIDVLETKTSDIFKPKGMLISSSRKHIIWYKEEIERLILEQPEAKRFDVVAAFTEFIHEGKRMSETDVEVNGKYARSIVKSFKDPNSNVKLIIVADKFQTGFDEPLLHTMYIDKRLRGSNAVQTIGRANRSAPGKEDTCIVDFVNSRKDIGQAFALYWKMTSLKCHSNRTPQEAKLDRVSTRLLQVPGLEEGSMHKCIEHITIEDALRIKANIKDRLIEDDLRQYLALCDRLQVENKRIGYSFVRRLLQELALLRRRRRIDSFQSLLDEVTISIDRIEEEKGSILLGPDGQELQMPSDEAVRRQRSSQQQAKMTTDEVVLASNHEYNRRVSNMWEESKSRCEDPSAVPEIDKSTFEFAQTIWASRRNSVEALPLAPPDASAKRGLRERLLTLSRDAYGVLDREELTRRGRLVQSTGIPPIRERSPSPPPSALSPNLNSSTPSSSLNSQSVSEPRLTASVSSLPVASSSSSSSLSSSSYCTASNSVLTSSPVPVSPSEEDSNVRRSRERRPPPLSLVVRLLSTSQSDKNRRSALRALRDHVTYEESWSVVRELDGLRPLIALISNHERPSLENISSNLSERGWAIAALCELSRDEQALISFCIERNRDEIREQQGLQPLLKLISPESKHPPFIQELALKAIRNICLDNATNQRLVIELGGVNNILFHLTEPSTQYLQHESAAALSILSEDVAVCSLLKDHGTKFCEMLASSSSEAAQPSFLVSLLHIIKRLCQTDANFRKQAMKDEALWYITNRFTTASPSESLTREAQSLRSFLDPSNFNQPLSSKRFVPNLHRSRNETASIIAGSPASTSGSEPPMVRRLRSASVRESSAAAQRVYDDAAATAEELPGQVQASSVQPISRHSLRRSRSISAPIVVHPSASGTSPALLAETHEAPNSVEADEEQKPEV